MKILHINTYQEGGAAWCARKINGALVKAGIDSRMLFANGKVMPEGVQGEIAERDFEFWYSSPILASIKHLFMRLPWYMDEEKMKKIIEKNNTDKLFLHQPYSCYKNIAHHPLIEWADLIHLHWVSDFVDYPTFFKNVKKPIVWTLHDKYPVVGVQHYCSDFFPVPEQLNEIDIYCKKIKRKAVLQAKNLHVVAISEQMQLLCSSSDVLNGFPCTLIHNGVNIDVFKPRNILCTPFQMEIQSLPAKTIKFMFSAYSILDENKGLNRVIEALEETRKIIDVSIALIIVGGVKETDPRPMVSFPLIFTGLIKDQSVLSSLYTCMDFFIQSAYEETFAQTPLEAMACGTPVISTPCSGAVDLIRPFNGVICEGYDSSALKDGIIKAVSQDYDSQKIRDYIIENFDYNIIAKEYIELYNKILTDETLNNHNKL